MYLIGNLNSRICNLSTLFICCSHSKNNLISLMPFGSEQLSRQL